MNDEEKLKETFDFNSSETKKVLRKAKLFTLIRTVAISLIVFMLLSVIILIANAIMLNRIADNELLDEYLLDLVARPNTYTTHTQFNDGFLVGEAEYVTYRIVGNRPVYNGTYKIKYSIVPIVQSLYGTGRGQLIHIENESNENGVEFSHYNKVGHREMKFYHPYVEYETYPNNLALLEEIGEDKYLELALSFDQGYSLEEVQAMLPGEVKIAWYWVDTYSEENLGKMKGHYAELIGQDGQPTGEKQYQEPRILFANQVYGIKAIASSGEKLEEPWRNFIEFINVGRNKKDRYQPQFKNLYDVLSSGKGEITKDDIRVIGVVVTGDTASMKLFRNNNFIKATTLGIVTDKF